MLPNERLLKERMTELGLTQKTTAEAIGIAQSTLCLKLKGFRPFYLSEAEKLAEALGITDADFGKYFFCPDLRSAKNEEEPR